MWWWRRLCCWLVPRALPIANLHDNAVAAVDVGGGLGDLGLSSGGRHVDGLGFLFSVKKKKCYSCGDEMMELMMRRRVGLRGSKRRRIL